MFKCSRRLTALLMCVCLALTACNVATDNPTPLSSTEDQLEDQYQPTADTVVMYVGDEPVYYNEFTYYFSSQVETYTATAEAQESGFDPNLPLNEQYYPDSETTMEEIFWDIVSTDLQRFYAMCLEARANGFEMGDMERESIDAYFENLDAYTEQEGITDEQAFLYRYGVNMTREQMRDSLERQLTGLAYEEYVRGITDYSDAELETYYQEHKEEVQVADCNTVSVRFISFSNQQMARDVLDKFESGDRSEDSFIELVQLYATDEQDIENGGLYADLAPSTYDISQFDEGESWAFDSERKPGDYNIIPYDGGYDLAYFVKMGDPMWKNWSRYSLQNEVLQDIINRYPITYPSLTEAED